MKVIFHKQNGTHLKRYFYSNQSASFLRFNQSCIYYTISEISMLLPSFGTPCIQGVLFENRKLVLFFGWFNNIAKSWKYFRNKVSTVSQKILIGFSDKVIKWSTVFNQMTSHLFWSPYTNLSLTKLIVIFVFLIFNCSFVHRFPNMNNFKISTSVYVLYGLLTYRKLNDI